MELIHHPTGNPTGNPKYQREKLAPRLYSLIGPDLIELHATAAAMPQAYRTTYRADWLPDRFLWRIVFTTPPGLRASRQIEHDYHAARRALSARTTGKPANPAQHRRKNAADFAAERAARPKKPAKPRTPSGKPRGRPKKRPN